MDCERCPFLPRLEMLEANQRDNIKKSEAFEKEARAEISRLKEYNVETRVQYQNIVGILSNQQKQFDKLLSDVEELKQKPSERWNTAVAAVITAVIGIAVGWFAGGKTV